MFEGFKVKSEGGLPTMKLLEAMQIAGKTGVFQGRFQPLTRAHYQIIIENYKKFERFYIIVVVRKKKEFDHFLSGTERVSMLKKVLPKEVFVVQSDRGYVPDTLDGVNEKNKDITIITGGNRADSYKKQGTSQDKYTIKVKGASVEGVSATRVREMLKNNDFKSYKDMVAPGLDTKEWFDKLRAKIERFISK